MPKKNLWKCQCCQASMNNKFPMQTAPPGVSVQLSSFLIPHDVTLCCNAIWSEFVFFVSLGFGSRKDI